MYNQQQYDYFKELVSCNFPLNFWKYDINMKLLSSDFKYHLRFRDGHTSEVAIEKKHLIPYMDEAALPLLISDSIGVMWAVVFEKDENKISNIHIMGPAFVNQKSLTHMQQLLSGYDLMIPTKRQILKYMEHLPMLTTTEFAQNTIMLHYCIRQEKIEINDIRHIGINNLAEQALSPLTEDEDNALSHHPYTHGYEQMITDAVRTGDLYQLSLLNQGDTVSRGVRVNSGDALIDGKFSAITLLTLCSRAAIEGGLPSTTAYSLNDTYSSLINQCGSYSQIRELNDKIFQEFITRVHDIQSMSHVSTPIQACRDYISMHIFDEIDLEMLAQLAGYSTYYFSRKFKEETGCSVKQYIQEQRIEKAKMLLETTTESISSISDSLHFCARSYFTDVFIKKTGQSPGDYRKAHYMK